MKGQAISYTTGAIMGAHQGTLDALIVVALRVTNQAKALAPVDLARLKGSIMWLVGNEEGGFGQQGNPEPGDRIQISTIDKKGKITGVVGTAVPYSVYQEFGTRYSAGNPFMRPAILIITRGALATSAVRDIMVSNMRENLKRNVKRYNVG